MRVSLLATIVALFFTSHVEAHGWLFTETADYSDKPYGWDSFCSRHPRDCSPIRAEPQIIRYSNDVRHLLETVNSSVNAAIISVKDLEQYGRTDFWEYPTSGRGDCEDYVLEKRKLLLEFGFPRTALIITVVNNFRDGHAVLMVRTTAGDYVLDNIRPYVVHWTKLKYEWLKRQAPDGVRWVEFASKKPPPPPLPRRKPVYRLPTA